MSELEGNVIDWEVVKELESLDDGDGSVLKDFYKVFQETVDQSLLQLSKNSRLENLPEVVKIAHSLKSSFGNLGVVKCQNLSIELEKVALAERLPESKAIVTQIKSGYAVAKQEIESYMSKKS